MKRNLWFLLVALVPSLLFAGCQTSSTGGAPASTKNSPYTHGNVQLNLEKGKTTQTEVLEVFGPPNIATLDGSGNEVWSYQKNATMSSSSSGYATIVLAGGQSAKREQSSRTMTLIIKFDEKKIVKDFNSMTTSF